MRAPAHALSGAPIPDFVARVRRLVTRMKTPLLILFTALLSSSAMATETADYKVTSQDGKFEIRDYPALKVARTTSGQGDFMRLFRYISGNNEGGQKIAMTAPVLIRHEGEKQGMSFFMPRDVAAGAVPKPTDGAVELDAFGPGHFAVARFSGGRNPANESKALEALRRWMASQQLQPDGAPIFAYYDPPWIPGFLRRNEVMLRVARGS